MSRVLALKSSILGDYSQSNKLVEDFIKNVDQDKLTVRDLAANPLPVLDFAVATALRATEDPADPVPTLFAERCARSLSKAPFT